MLVAPALPRCLPIRRWLLCSRPELCEPPVTPLFFFLCFFFCLPVRWLCFPFLRFCLAPAALLFCLSCWLLWLASCLLASVVFCGACLVCACFFLCLLLSSFLFFLKSQFLFLHTYLSLQLLESHLSVTFLTFLSLFAPFFFLSNSSSSFNFSFYPPLELLECRLSFRPVGWFTKTSHPTLHN